MDLDGIAGERLHEARKGGVVLRAAIEQREIAIHEHAEGLLAHFEHLIDAAGEIFRHADVTRDLLLVLIDVRIREKHPKLLRDLGGVEMRGRERAESGRRGLLQPVATRGGGGEGDGHGKRERWEVGKSCGAEAQSLREPNGLKIEEQAIADFRMMKRVRRREHLCNQQSMVRQSSIHARRNAESARFNASTRRTHVPK